MANWAWTVSAADVKIAPTSGVGSGSCPKLQADRISESKIMLASKKLILFRIGCLHKVTFSERRICFIFSL
jgi:hypothetical protein